MGNMGPKMGKISFIRFNVMIIIFQAAFDLDLMFGRGPSGSNVYLGFLCV